MDNSFEEAREEIERKLDWLLNEIARLTQEKRRLLRQNRKLREEITLLRLKEERPSAEGVQKESARSASQEALHFYEQLPPCLNFAMFFRLAEGYGISSKRAKRYLLHFLREEMLQQKGSHIEKTDVLNGPVGSAL